MKLSVLYRPVLTGVVASMALLGVAACQVDVVFEADLVLRGGKVVTVDENVPDGQAIAMHSGINTGLVVTGGRRTRDSAVGVVMSDGTVSVTDGDVPHIKWVDFASGDMGSGTQLDPYNTFMEDPLRISLSFVEAVSIV